MLLSTLLKVPIVLAVLSVKKCMTLYLCAQCLIFIKVQFCLQRHRENGRVLSRITPRLLTFLETGITSSPMEARVLGGSVVVDMVDRYRWVPTA